MKHLFILFSILIFTSFTFLSEGTTPLDKINILRQVNALRAQGCECGGVYMQPTKPLKWDDQLYKSAFTHAKDMDRHGYFSHFNRSGQDIGERLDAMGYNWQVAGENLGEGQRIFSEVLEDWIESKSHCKMLMNPKVKDMAVARYGRFWVQHFGKRLPGDAVVSKE